MNKINPTHHSGKMRNKNFVAAAAEKPIDNKTNPKYLQCNHCKKKGHTEAKCFRLQECFQCKKKGHISKYCKEKKSEKLESATVASLLNYHSHTRMNERDAWLFDPGSSAKVVNEKHCVT